MAIIRSIQFTVLLATVFFTVSSALYEDQVGKFDWKRSLIGKVKHAKLDNKRLFVTTHENVVASLNLKSGQIQWRHPMENPTEEQPYLLHLNRDLITVSGSKNNFHVRGWDPLTGSLSWEWGAVTERKIDSFWTTSGEFLFHVVPLLNSHVEVTKYHLKTGEIRGTIRRINGAWVGNRCVVINLYLICISSDQLFLVNVETDQLEVKMFSIQSLINGGDTQSLQIVEFIGSKPAVLLATPTSNKATLIEIEGGSVKPYNYDLSANIISFDNTIYQLEANLGNPDKLIKVNSLNILNGQQISSVEVDYPLGLGGPYIIGGQCSDDSACHLVLSSTDNALTLVRLPEGKVIWTREEALSEIVAVQFLELPVSELDASIETEFAASSGDIISMLTHRLSTQFRQFCNLFFGGQFLANNALVRDEFGLHKIIVVATGVGKLFGIDTLTGLVVWSYRLPNVKVFNDLTMLLFVQRTARYAPLPAQCILLAEDVGSGEGILFQFDPISGASSRGIQRLNYKIKQALLLPQEDENHIRPVLVIAENDSVHIFPDDGKTVIQNHGGAIYIYAIQATSLKGYKLESDLHLKQVWEVNLGPSHLISISTRPTSERVHSQGRVLPNRNVYYKYVNPNLIAFATLSDDPVHKHVVSVYLIDGVTGLVLYSTSHKKSKGPVYLVHSENWLVYSFFNERFRRHEVVAAELYEGLIQSNTTAFSSFGVSQLPHVQIQSYILPANPVYVTATLTERGVTNKFLLVGLSSGGVLEIPWLLLQPRFPEIPCGPEESCIPYMPEIPIPSEAFINYNQTLERIKGIEVAPARLESTSHVLVHGLDLFYTRVAPSKTFDMLKEDFDHKLIILVLSGLIAASYITKYLAARKTLRQAWK